MQVCDDPCPDPEAPTGPTIEIDQELLEAVLASAERIGNRSLPIADAPPAPTGAEPAGIPVAILPEELVESLEDSGSLDREQAARIAAEARTAVLEKAVRDHELERARLERALQVLRARLEARETDLNTIHRRFGREMEYSRQQAADHVLREVVPILDLLLVADRHAQADASTVFDGVRMVLNQFQRILDRMGVLRIPTDPGTAFDPAVHEAILQVPHDTLPPGAIAEEIRPGWRVADRLLVAARVAVVGPAYTPGPSDPPDADPLENPSGPASENLTVSET